MVAWVMQTDDENRGRIGQILQRHGFYIHYMTERPDLVTTFIQPVPIEHQEPTCEVRIIVIAANLRNTIIELAAFMGRPTATVVLTTWFRAKKEIRIAAEAYAAQNGWCYLWLGDREFKKKLSRIALSATLPIVSTE